MLLTILEQVLWFHPWQHQHNDDDTLNKSNQDWSRVARQLQICRDSVLHCSSCSNMQLRSLLARCGQPYNQSAYLRECCFYNPWNGSTWNRVCVLLRHDLGCGNLPLELPKCMPTQDLDRVLAHHSTTSSTNLWSDLVLSTSHRKQPHTIPKKCKPDFCKLGQSFFWDPSHCRPHLRH